jgi:hypothetical protein
MACDICSKTGTELTELNSIYKTTDVQHICPSCEKALTKQVSKLRSVTHNILIGWMKSFIRVRKEARNGE